MSQVRQGDVLLEAVDVPDAGSLVLVPGQLEGRAVVAVGEATGHEHAVEGPGVRLYQGPMGRLLHVPNGNGAVLRHPEHGPIALPPGRWYRVVQQEAFVPPPQVEVARTPRSYAVDD